MDRIDVPVTEPEFRILAESLNHFLGHLTKQYADVHQWAGPDVMRLDAEQKCAERIDAYNAVCARLNIYIQTAESPITESQAGVDTK